MQTIKPNRAPFRCYRRSIKFLRSAVGAFLCIQSTYLAATQSDNKESHESAITFKLKASHDKDLCNELGMVFNENADDIAAGQFDKLTIFPKWSNPQKVVEKTQKSVEADAIQELWIDLDNDHHIDHVYKTRLSVRGAKREALHILTPEKDSVASERGIAISDFLDPASIIVETDFGNRKEFYELTGRKDSKEIEKWDMGPIVVQFPFSFSAQTFVAAYNAFAPPNVEANLYIFSVHRTKGRHQIKSVCLFKRIFSH